MPASKRLLRGDGARRRRGRCRCVSRGPCRSSREASWRRWWRRPRAQCGAFRRGRGGSWGLGSRGLGGFRARRRWGGGSGGEAWRSQVQLAYDREYLYVAAICEKPPGAPTPPPTARKPGDAAVDADDHIALRLDVDRDYASYYELLIDSRALGPPIAAGATSAWNPEWFIAAGGFNADGGMWIVEIAIPGAS